MLDYWIDGERVNIDEEVVTESISHDIVGDKFVTKKTFNKTVSTQIYTQSNGVSVCFKLDDNGANEFFEILFVLVEKQIQKNVLTASRTAQVWINKIDDTHYHILMNDDTNHENTLTLATIKDDSIQLCTLNATKILQHDIAKGKYLLFSSVEQIDEKKSLYVVGVYDLSGIMLKSFVDCESEKELVYKFEQPDDEKVFVGIENGKKFKRIDKFIFPQEVNAEPEPPSGESNSTEGQNEQ